MLKQFLYKLSMTVLVTVLGSVLITGAYAQNRTVSGKVVDNNGLPVIGASVLVVGTSNQGTVTDVDGLYELSVPAGSSLNFSCIGYKSIIEVVGNRTVINVTLDEDAEFLEETVVIGYGVQKKSDVTGAIASVKSTDLENRTTTDIAQALQGKAAGVQICAIDCHVTPDSLTPGEPVAVRLLQ